MTMLHGSNQPLFRVLASPFFSLQQALTACDDCWTWTTLSGETYEDVELISLSSEEVTFRHDLGIRTIPRADLTRDIQQSLIDNSEMAEPGFADEADVPFSASDKRAASRGASLSKAA